MGVADLNQPGTRTACMGASVWADYDNDASYEDLFSTNVGPSLVVPQLSWAASPLATAEARASEMDQRRNRDLA